MALELTNEQLSVNAAILGNPNTIIAQQADLLAKYNIITGTDSSAAVTIAYIDASMAKYTLQTYTSKVDASIATNWAYALKVDASIAANRALNLKSDASIATNWAYALKQDASIALKTDMTYSVKQDASIATNWAYALKQDASIAALLTPDLTFATNASVGLAFLTNSSLGNLTSLKADKTYVDGSMNTLNASINIASFVTNSSLATGSVVKEYNPFNAYRTGLKDASGVNGSMFVQDASLYIKINGFWAMIACTSIGLGI